MDPCAVLADVIADGKITREQGANYNEWMAKGGFGARVALHPASDRWMMGTRYATVVRLGYTKVGLVDDAGRTFQMSPRMLLEVVR